MRRLEPAGVSEFKMLLENYIFALDQIGLRCILN